eukprot:9089869-Alexandrium_andersonii.AAC.1
MHALITKARTRWFGALARSSSPVVRAVLQMDGVCKDWMHAAVESLSELKSRCGLLDDMPEPSQDIEAWMRLARDFPSAWSKYLKFCNWCDSPADQTVLRFSPPPSCPIQLGCP